MIKNVPSNPENIVMVQGYIERVIEKFRVSPDLYGDILISLTEAVNNAIIHGNLKDESKTVQIRVAKQDDALSFKVSDEGGGFDYREIPDPTAPGHLHTTGGRGVFIMNELCDNLKFHNNGSTVEMRFKI